MKLLDFIFDGMAAVDEHVDFVGTLSITFVLQKLCGAITWSWWWVCAPWLAVVGMQVVLRVWVRYLIWQQAVKRD